MSTIQVYLSIIIIFVLIVNLKFLLGIDIIAKSTINYCKLDSDEVKNEMGKLCRKKIIVALTVPAQGGLASLRSELSRIKENSNEKPKILKSPIRIVLSKNPGYIQFDLLKVGRINFMPKEHVRIKSSCNDNPQSKEIIACGYYTNLGKTDFNSFGTCCRCSDTHNFLFSTPWLRNGIKCGWFNTNGVSEHCMRLSNLFLNVYSFRPPRVVFDITVKVYALENGHWNLIGKAQIGPHKTTVFLKDRQIRLDFSGDFAPKIRFYNLHTKYLLAPDPSTVPASVYETSFPKQGKKEWLVAEKSKVDLFGETCNKMGVWFNAFKAQSEFCEQRQQSCLQNQPGAYWKRQLYLRHQKKPYPGLLSYYGELIGDRDKDLSIKFKNPSIGKSQVIVTLAADFIKFVTFKTGGKIMSSFIDNFEALSTHGTIKATILNSGNFTTTFHVGVYKCSAGIEPPNGRIQTINPMQTVQISMKIYAHHPLHKAHKCFVYLRDRDGKFLHELPIIFETYSTCFCPIHCNCSCTNSSSAPDIGENLKPPISKNETYARYATDFCVVESEASQVDHDSESLLSGFAIDNVAINIFDKLENLVYGKFDSTVEWIIKVLPFVIAISIIFIIVIVLVTLRIKMIFSGNFNMPEITILNNIIKNCCTCVSQNLLILYNKRSKKSSDIAKKGWKSDNTSGYSIPSYCNGLCEGCDFARNKYRRKLLKLRKYGLTMQESWWDMPHTCTCRVEKTRNIISTIVGLFYFFYCAFIPFFNCGIYIYRVLFRNKNTLDIPEKIAKHNFNKKNKVRRVEDRK